MTSDRPNNLFKIAVCGEGGVGKSNLTLQWVQNQFIEAWDPTVEDLYNKQTEIDGTTFMVNVQDTAGQDEYEILRDGYMRDNDGFLLVFDVTNEKSFIGLQRFYEQIKRTKDVEYPILVVCGNKCDLPDRVIPTEKVKELCSKWKCKYFETSAKLRINVDESFEALLKSLKKSMFVETDQSETKEQKSSNPKKKLCTIF